MVGTLQVLLVGILVGIPVLAGTRVQEDSPGQEGTAEVELRLVGSPVVEGTSAAEVGQGTEISNGELLLYLYLSTAKQGR